MNRKQRDANRSNSAMLRARFGERHECPNCGQLLGPGEGHFVPPSFGEPGFYLCRGKLSESNAKAPDSPS